MNTIGKIYLFPTTLGDSELSLVLPEYNIKLISEIKYFIVEDVRTARRFLKKCNQDIQIDELTFFELNQHTDLTQIQEYVKPALNGSDIGILSEAGCPAIADPGADIVAVAQKKNLQVVPLVGPSSILMALMASGFNGQSFAFNGYLPIQNEDRIKAIRKFENRASTEKQSQIFIETPYRNNKLFELLLKTLRSETLLCVAADITLKTEFIKTSTVKNWQANSIDLSKRPCIFIVYS